MSLVDTLLAALGPAVTIAEGVAKIGPAVVTEVKAMIAEAEGNDDLMTKIETIGRDFATAAEDIAGALVANTPSAPPPPPPAPAPEAGQGPAA